MRIVCYKSFGQYGALLMFSDSVISQDLWIPNPLLLATVTLFIGLPLLILVLFTACVFDTTIKVVVEVIKD